MSSSRCKKTKFFTLQRPVLESMEPRVLYSADPLAALVGDVFSDLDNQQSLLNTDVTDDWLLADAVETDSTTALYIVDKAVNDYELLIESLQLQDSDELLLIDSDSGLAEISAMLLQHNGLSELHFFTHSEGSGLRLGADVLDFESAGDNAELLRQWSSALTEQADILLYGCNLAATADGIAFVDLLAELTSADVAASTNLTGADEYNADWLLEHNSGEIESDIAQKTRSLDGWNGVLANLLVTTELDVLDGDVTSVSALLGNQGADGLISLREAIIAANNTAGADSITLAAPTTTYTISMATAPMTADAWETGDFDIDDDLLIRGDASVTTTISGGFLDRVFEIHSGDVEFHDLTITEGLHMWDAGVGLSVTNANLGLFNVSVAGNASVNGIGGGVFLGNGSTLTASGTDFLNNSAIQGGALFVELGANANIHEADIFLNTSSSDGGAISTNGYLYVSGTDFKQNAAVAAGGALSLGFTGHATLYDVDFNDNQARNGGAINNLGDLTIEGVEFSGNKAQTAGSSSNADNIGGAIYSSGPLDLLDSTFDRNTANSGGGIFSDGAYASAGNVTFDGNEAMHLGGALYVNSNQFDVEYSTFTGNVGHAGGGAFFINPNTLSLSNSILGVNPSAGVMPPPNTNFSAGYNVSAGLMNGEEHLTDITLATLNLGPLQDNGGLVATRALLPGSDAIDAGTTGPRVDATGRPSNEISDAGAFEYRQTTENVKVYWTDEIGHLIYRANSTGGANPTLFGVQAIAQTVFSPWDIEYDTVNQRIIWSENNGGSSGRIMQSDLSGQSQIVLADNSSGIPGLQAPRGLALDLINGKLYVINDAGNSGWLNTILSFDLDASSITYDATLSLPAGTNGFIDPQDIELWRDSELSEDWLAWTDNRNPGEPVVFGLYNLGLSLLWPIPATGANPPTEFSALSWNEVNNSFYGAHINAVDRSEWDISGSAPVFVSNIAQAQSFASGVHFNPLHNNVYSTQLGSGLSNGQINVYAEDLSVGTVALAAVSTPKHITLATVSALAEPPVLQANNRLTVNEGASRTISDIQLDVIDADTPSSAIVFTLDSDLLNGALELSGAPIGMGQTFTQQDIDSGLLSYVHDHSETTLDYFLFSVTDGIHVLDGQRFDIDITPVNDHVPVAGNASMTLAEDQLANTAEDASAVVFGNLAAIAEDDDVGDILTYSLVGSPGFGVATVNPDGTFSYDFNESLESASDVLNFRVTDTNGQSADGSITITILPINDSVPQATADAILLNEGGAVSTLAGAGNSLVDNDADDDLPDDTLTIDSSSVGTFATLNGAITINVDGTFSYTHDGSETSADSYTYTLTDAAGQTSTAVVNITIDPVNDNPPVLPDKTIVVNEGDSATSFQSGAVSVLDGLVDIDVGDTHAVQLTPVSGPANGTVVLNADNTFLYTHDDSETTNDQFVYRVTDSVGNSTDVTVDVVVVPVNDHTPFVPNKFVTLAEGETVSTLVSGSPDLLLGLVDDDLGDTHAVQIIPVSGPGNGTLTLNTNNTFSYTHDGSETTTDQFVYQVTDSGGNSKNVTVNVAIALVNDNAPVVPDKVIVVDEGDVATDFQSGDFKLLDGLIDNDLGDTHTVQPTPVSGPSNGAVIFNADNTFSYVHDGSETTTDQFVYLVTDSGGLSTNVTVDVFVNPVNDNAPFVPGKVIVINEGDQIAAFQSGATDMLIGLVDDDLGDTHTAQITSASGPVNGTLVINPDNTFSYTHDDSETTADQFVYQVTDSGGLSTNVTVDIVVNLINDNAPFLPGKLITVNEGASIAAFQSGATDMLIGLSDDDLGDTHTVDTVPVLGPVNGTLVINADNTFNYTHDGSETTTDQFIYRVIDSGGKSSNVQVDIVIVPLNDNLPEVPDKVIVVDEGDVATTFQSGASLLQGLVDGDAGDTHSVQLVAFPLNGTVVFNTDNTFSYTHDDSETTTDQFVYRVTDSGGNSTNVTVDVVVNRLHDHVPFVPGKTLIVNEGQATQSFQSGATDLLLGLVDDDLGDAHTVQLVPVSGPVNGSVVLNPDNTFIYTHDDSETTTDQFVYQVIDSGGNTANVTVNVIVNPVNDHIPFVPNRGIVVNEGDFTTTFQSGDTSLLQGLVDGDAGDVHTVQPIPVSGPANGSVVFNADNTFVYMHNDSETLSDQFVYRVTDSGGNVRDVTVDVVVNPINDHAPFLPHKFMAVDEGATINSFQSGATDLLFGLSDLDLGDIHTVQTTPVSGPTNGIVILNADNTFSYTHDGSETTSDQFVYRVTDNGGNSRDVIVNVLISAVNDNAPFVPGDTITLPEGGVASVFDSGRTSLLENISDADVGDTAIVLATPVSGPAHGSVVFNPDASFSYTHDGSETSSDQFVYSVQDAQGHTTDVSVNVSVLAVNDAPLGQDRSVSLLEDAAYIFQQADFGFSDPSEQHDFAGIVLEALPSDGTLMLAGVPVSVSQVISIADISAGNLAFVASAELNGVVTDPLSFRVVDSGGTALGGQDTDVLSRDISLTIVSVNDAPAGADATIQAIEDTPLVIAADAFGFSDVNDGDEFGGVVISAVPASGSLMLSGQAVQAGALVPGQAINNGELVYVPAAEIHGPGVAVIGFRVVDSGGVSNGGIDTASANTLDIDVASVNDSPFSSASIPDITVVEGQALQFQISASAFGDVDGDSLQLSISQSDGMPVPAWLNFNALTGELDAAPGFTDSGVYGLLVTATDSSGASASQVFDLQVLETNLPPTGLLPLESTVDENLSGLALASLIVNDPDVGDSHTLAVDDPRFTIVNGQLLLASGNELSFEVESQVGLVITITDSDGASADVPFIVNVNDLNDTPEVQAEPVIETGLAPFSVELPDNLFSDEDGDLLSLSATLQDGSPLPDWLIFDAAAGTLSVAENAPVDADISVIVTADDGNGGLASTVIQLMIEPAAAAALPEEPPVAAEPVAEVVELVSVVAEIDQPDVEVEVEAQESESVEEEAPLVDQPVIAAAGEEPEVDLLSIAEVLNNISPEFVSVPAVGQELDQLWSPDSENQPRAEQSRTQFSQFSNIKESIPLARLLSNTPSLVLSPIHSSLAGKIDQHKEELREYQLSVERVTQTTVSVGTGISVGYIVWLLRSGVVLGSMLSALPAWRSIDPLPILGSLEDMDDEDQESLESMVEGEQHTQERSAGSIIKRVFKR